MHSPFLRFVFASLIFALLLVTRPLVASADGESLQILSLTPRDAVQPGTQVSFVAASSGFTDPTYRLVDDFSMAGSTVGALDKVGYFTWTPGANDAGRHNLTIYVNDTLGHSATSTLTIVVAGNALSVNSIAPGPITTPGRTLTFSVTAPGFTAPFFSVYDSAFGSSLNTTAINSSSGAFSWTPTPDDIGAHSLTIMASDPYGHSAQTQQKISVVRPYVEVLTLQPGATVPVGTPISFTASSPAFATTTFAIGDVFTGTSSVTTNSLSSEGRFRWTPLDADIGTHLLTVTATDVYGNAASSTLPVWVIGSVPQGGTQPSQPLFTASTTISGTTASPALASHYIFTTTLTIGSRGKAVTELQKRLTALGYYTGPVTGYYGALTATGVKKFQGAHGIAKVGTVGPATRAALNT